MSWLGSLGSSLLGGLGKFWSGSPSGLLGAAASALGAGSKTLGAIDPLGSALGNYGGSSGNDTVKQLLVANALNNNGSSNTQTADNAVENAASTSTQNQTQTAQTQAKAAKNAGLTQARANAIGDASTYGNTIASNANSAASNQTMTQADWLNKQGQIGSAMLQAQNMKNAARYAGISGALQGGAAGMSMGATISDENAKEAPSDGIDDNKLNEAIKEFRELKRKLDKLKENNKCQ